MANSTTNLDLISASQSNKEVTANALMDAASPAMLYGRRAVTSEALTWGYYGGTVSISGTPTQVANGTVTLAASATNYVEADPATGAVSVNQAGFTTGRTPLYSVATGVSSVTSYTDLRVLGGGSSAPVTSVNTQTGDVVLDAGDVGADPAGTATSAVGTHEAASDPHPQYLTQTEGDARYSAAGSGGTVTSVSLSAPSALLSVGGSPVTGSGTLSLSLAAQAVNTVFAGPASGGNAVPTFRSLTPADLPVMVGSGASHAAGIVPDPGSTAGTTRFLREDGTWASVSGASGGTVTSVGLSVPGLLYTVAGSPVTGSGTLTTTLKTQVKNTFLAGPTAGADAAPTMRALVAADLPVMGSSGASHSAGAVPDPGATAGTTRFLREDGTWVAPASGGGGLTNWTDGVSTTAPNASTPVASLKATNAASATDVAIVPKGAGNLAAAVADGTTAGGNKRGAYAVDWQMQRTAIAQVASGNSSVVSGGNNNTASGIGSTVAGGTANQATGAVSFAVGESNVASFSWSVALGYSCTSSKEASVAMGYGCIADGHYSVATGYRSTTRGMNGARVHAGYTFTGGYDCQDVRIILNGETSSSSPKVLTCNGSQLTIKTNSSMSVKGLVVSRNESNGDTKSWSFEASLKSISGTVSLVAPCTPTVIATDSGASSWTLSVTADNTNKALSVAFTGPGGYWVASVATLTAVEYSL